MSQGEGGLVIAEWESAIFALALPVLQREGQIVTEAFGTWSETIDAYKKLERDIVTYYSRIERNS